jgi:hypothetical protein
MSAFVNPLKHIKIRMPYFLITQSEYHSMKNLIVIATLCLFALSAQAFDIADGSQHSAGGTLQAWDYSEGVWTFSMTNGLQFKDDASTPFKFKGYGKNVTLANVKPGARLDVRWCVGHAGFCDTRAEVIRLYDFDPSEINRTVTVEAVR